MNAPQSPRTAASPSTPRRAPSAPAIPGLVRTARRERDFGVGYGNSSGYASARHYTDGHADPLFRCR